MKVSHKISFQMGQSFEQHSAEFSLEESDLQGFLGDLHVVEKMLILNAVILINGLLFQLAEGYIDKARYLAQYSRIDSLLSQKLKEVLSAVLKGPSK